MKLTENPIHIDSLDCGPFNKNQILEFTCKVCGKQVFIKYVNFKKKKELSCKSCAIKIHSEYKERGKKISESRRKNPTPYEKMAAAQINRSEEAKKKTIEKFRNTMSKKDMSIIRKKISEARRNMTPEQEKQRVEKFLNSYYKSQGKKLENTAERILKASGFQYEKKENILYECTCNVCSSKWLWSSSKKSQYYSQSIFCPKCFSDKRSHYEVEICRMLDSLNVIYIENDRKILNGKEIDIYIPSVKLGIEFDGIYWHNNSKKTLEKYEILKSKGITLINIFENEYNLKKLQSIIEAKLHLSKIIYARKCFVKEIDSKLYSDFCNENHIQSCAPASVKLGLFLDNKLIQIMSFSKPRFSKKYEWEIIRECSLCGYGIVGGKNKLFRYFIKHYNPISIISYCDKRFFDGKSYLQMGMRQLPDSKSSYFYTNGKKTLSRYQCQKHKLKNLLDNFDQSLTEYENMLNAGYFKLYDFGQRIFEWHKMC